MSIAIYSAEADAGLADKIRSTASIAYASVLELAEPFEVADRTIAKAKSVADQAKASQTDFDLHYLKSILASTVWNKNDDVFDPVETWLARRTPEDKPVNRGHDCADIVGHMTSSHCVDEDGTLLLDDTVIDKLPEKFHVISGAVLYKYWSKPDLQDKMDQLLADISEGKKYVSMEALFKGFDYALRSASGEMRVVARNEQTAFLTKHLRIYGGTGQYDGYSVGRVMRNITFSGKGIVDKPANAESIIFADAEPFVVTAELLTNFSHNSKNRVYSTVSTKGNDNPMTTPTNEQTVEQLQRQVAELQKQLRDSDVQRVQAQLDEALEATKAAEAQVAELTENVTAKTGELDGVNKRLSETEASLKTTTEELTKIKAEQKRITRIASVKATLKVDEANDESVAGAVALAESLIELSDENFEKHLQGLAKFTPAPTPPKQTPAQEPPKSTSKPAPMSGKAEEDEAGAETAEAADLETAEAEADPALSANETVETGVSELQRSIAQYFGSTVEGENE